MTRAPDEGPRSKQGSFPEAGAISDRDRRKRNQNVSESGRIRDRRIFDGGARDREFGESGSNSERDFDAVEECRSSDGGVLGSLNSEATRKAVSAGLAVENSSGAARGRASDASQAAQE